MNTITLPIAELKPALNGLGKLINRNASLPVLGTVRIERTPDGWIALTSTDLDRFVTLRLEQPAQGEPLALLVPYEDLCKLTKNCGRDERLLVEPGPDNTALLKFALADQLGATRVPSLPVEEFPVVPRVKCEPMALPPELRQCIHEAMDCASTDATRYVLNGTFIDAANPKANYIVGTDGRHLYSANSFILPLKNSLIIPNHKFLGWKEFNADGEWQLKADDTHVQLSSRRWRFISRQIDAQYPDWRNPIPNPADARTVITLDPAQLEGLTKLIGRMPSYDERHGTIGLEWKQGQLRLLSKATPQEPWLRVPVPNSTGEGPELTMFLDRRYLIKALQFGLNTISLSDELSPLRFHNKGKQMIVMPLRPEGTTAPAPAEEPQPAVTPATAPNLERTPMLHNTAPEASTPSGDDNTPPTIEDALQTVDALKDSFQNGITTLKDLSAKLKQIQREHKTNAKDLQQFRSTLRTLQSVRL